MLTGKFEKGEMTLSTQPRKLSVERNLLQEWFFYNITTKSFDWRWESTNDNGTTWKTNWLIHY